MMMRKEASIYIQTQNRMYRREDFVCAQWCRWSFSTCWVHLNQLLPQRSRLSHISGQLAIISLNDERGIKARFLLFFYYLIFYFLFLSSSDILRVFHSLFSRHRLSLFPSGFIPSFSSILYIKQIHVMLLFKNGVRRPFFRPHHYHYHYHHRNRRHLFEFCNLRPDQDKIILPIHQRKRTFFFKLKNNNIIRGISLWIIFF